MSNFERRRKKLNNNLKSKSCVHVSLSYLPCTVHRRPAGVPPQWLLHPPPRWNHPGLGWSWTPGLCQGHSHPSSQEQSKQQSSQQSRHQSKPCQVRHLYRMVTRAILSKSQRHHQSLPQSPLLSTDNLKCAGCHRFS